MWRLQNAQPTWRSVCWQWFHRAALDIAEVLGRRVLFHLPCWGPGQWPPLLLPWLSVLLLPVVIFVVYPVLMQRNMETVQAVLLSAAW